MRDALAEAEAIPAALPLAEVLLQRYADARDRPFVAFEGGPSFTYGQALRRAASVAKALGASGIAKGERVLVALDNGPAFIDAWFGCALAGIVMVPLNTLLQGRVLEDIVARSRCSGVIATHRHLGALDALTRGYRARIVVDAGDARAEKWTPYERVVADDADPQRISIAGSDPMSIMFTSGTTGPPKGAILSQAHCTARSDSYRVGLRIDETDVMFTCLPLFHNNAQMATVLVGVLARGRVAIYNRFSVSRFWSFIRESEATRFTLIGRMANMLLAAPVAPGERDHKMRSACIVPHPNGEDAFEKRFGVRVISQYYGCTEMIPLAPRIDQERRIGSCGLPTPGFECMALDEWGQPVPDGEIGELVARPVRPEGVMSGYFDMPAETLHAFRGLWYHTGDAVRRDSEGFFYLVGRLKDFIRKRGENISAAAVEEALAGHVQLADSAAVGEPDEWGEEDVVLYVEPKAGCMPDAAELLRLCEGKLPAFMVPARIHLIEKLPRNALGRIEKFKLRGGRVREPARKPEGRLLPARISVSRPPRSSNFARSLHCSAWRCWTSTSAAS